MPTRRNTLLLILSKPITKGIPKNSKTKFVNGYGRALFNAAVDYLHQQENFEPGLADVGSDEHSTTGWHEEQKPQAAE